MKLADIIDLETKPHTIRLSESTKQKLLLLSACNGGIRQNDILNKLLSFEMDRLGLSVSKGAALDN